jgi:hypothetical protein
VPKEAGGAKTKGKGQQVDLAKYYDIARSVGGQRSEVGGQEKKWRKENETWPSSSSYETKLKFNKMRDLEEVLRRGLRSHRRSEKGQSGTQWCRTEKWCRGHILTSHKSFIK